VVTRCNHIARRVEGSDTLAVIENLATKAVSLIIGGGMCRTFLAAQRLPVGGSLLEEEMIDTCRNLLETDGDVIHLPVDIVVAEKFAADSPPSTVATDKIPADKMGLDIGPESVILRAAVERQDGVLERVDQGFRVPGLSPPNHHRGGSRGPISFR
jgi:3-phosphoglycerate kinase